MKHLLVSLATASLLTALVPATAATIRPLSVRTPRDGAL